MRRSDGVHVPQNVISKMPTKLNMSGFRLLSWTKSDMRKHKKPNAHAHPLCLFHLRPSNTLKIVSMWLITIIRGEYEYSMDMCLTVEMNCFDRVAQGTRFYGNPPWLIRIRLQPTIPRRPSYFRGTQSLLGSRHIRVVRIVRRSCSCESFPFVSTCLSCR